jgi:hypothetical protein
VTKAQLIREIWGLIRLHKSGPYCKKNGCALRGQLRQLVKAKDKEKTDA